MRLDRKSLADGQTDAIDPTETSLGSTEAAVTLEPEDKGFRIIARKGAESRGCRIRAYRGRGREGLPGVQVLNATITLDAKLV
jgi:hypothetical protein